MTKLKSTICAFCVAVLTAATLVAAPAQASSLDDWTAEVEQRLDTAMRSSSFVDKRHPLSGIVRVKLVIAPDGSVLSATPVGAVSNDLRSAGKRVAARLKQLPPLPDAQVPTAVTLLLGFGTSDVDGKQLQQQLAQAKAESRVAVASR